MGFILPQFKEGTLLLESTTGKKIRLVWEKSQAKKSNLRALPPGKYRLRNYTLTREDRAGTRWMLSATGRAIRQIHVRNGRTTLVKIPQTIFLKPRARVRGGNLHVGVSIQGEHHSGMTIYKAGKRIPIRFSLKDADKRELASGNLKYG